MEQQLQRFLEKMDEKINNVKDQFSIQVEDLTQKFTNSVTSTIEEKLTPLVEENLKLKKEVTTLKRKTYELERVVRKNNVILHGLEETEENNTQLMELVLNTLNEVGSNGKMENFDKWEISEVYRLGKRGSMKRRPILQPTSLSPRKPEHNKQQNYTPKPNTLPSRLVTVGVRDYHPPKQENSYHSYHNQFIDDDNYKDNALTTVQIASLNVLTLKTDDNLAELTNALRDIKWDILGLSEIRRDGEEILQRSDYLFYYKGEIPGRNGVGFLIKKHLIANVEEFIGISDRIALLNIKLPLYKDIWSVLQIYAPTEKADQETANKFYDDINETIIKYTHKNLIVMGDFNAQTGECQPGEETVLGPHTYGTKRSKNGEKLINLALGNNLTILNSKYKKKTKRKWTWVSPGGTYKNEIDFILTNKPKYFTDANVVNRFNFNTNHRMVRAELRIQKHKNPRPKYNPTKIKRTSQQYEDIVSNLAKKCVNYMKDTNKMEVQDKYNWIENSITSAIKTVREKEQKTKKFSSKTMNLLEERKELISSINSDSKRRRISELSKEINHSIRKDRKQSRMETIERHIIASGGIKKAHKELLNSKRWITKVRDAGGINKSRRVDIKTIATNYYKELYRQEHSELECELDPAVDTDSDIPCVLQREVEKAIETQSSDKAPGPDGIDNEILTKAKEVLAPIFTSLFNDILKTESIPEQWTKSHIILLYKKGDKHNIGNYRPINLMSNIYKTSAKPSTPYSTERSGRH
ncbi:uncharacterized protein LOC142979615 [Anticarsia gemmatalis]|uniref:uncharacterized protein LOC142979615 n=1 Tax=Anticarsia gemmatalis TaxID=129554 RepID=UPI003F75725A